MQFIRYYTADKLHVDARPRRRSARTASQSASQSRSAAEEIRAICSKAANERERGTGSDDSATKPKPNKVRKAAAADSLPS